MFWKVKLTVDAEVELKKLLLDQVITKKDISVLLRWVDEMEEFGPDHIAQSKEWHDHELSKRWVGYRSSAFSSAGRIIYRIVAHRVIVEVCRVTADHDYRK